MKLLQYLQTFHANASTGNLAYACVLISVFLVVEVSVEVVGAYFISGLCYRKICLPLYRNGSEIITQSFRADVFRNKLLVTSIANSAKVRESLLGFTGTVVFACAASVSAIICGLLFFVSMVSVSPLLPALVHLSYKMLLVPGCMFMHLF